MIRPHALRPLPSQLVTLLGAINATILYTAMLNLAPAVGLSFVDVPRILGGLFIGGAEASFWLGYALLGAVGIVLVPPILVQLWPTLPGNPLTFPGAALKGLIAGAALWIVTGLTLPLLELLSRAPVETTYGFFGLSAGAGTAAWLLAIHLAYALTLTLVASMTSGMKPLDTLGWDGHQHGDVREAALGLPSVGGAGLHIETKPR